MYVFFLYAADDSCKLLCSNKGHGKTACMEVEEYPVIYNTSECNHTWTPYNIIYGHVLVETTCLKLLPHNISLWIFYRIVIMFRRCIGFPGLLWLLDYGIYALKTCERGAMSTFPLSMNAFWNDLVKRNTLSVYREVSYGLVCYGDFEVGMCHDLFQHVFPNLRHLRK